MRATRWSLHMGPYTWAYFAGHSDFSTTRRYVHPNPDTARAAMERASVAQGGPKKGHGPELTIEAEEREAVVLQ